MAEISGLKLIVPSSVSGSGVSVSTSGKVTFTSAPSVSINGCFSANYDNYLIVMRCVHPSFYRSVNVRMRSGGTDATGSNYTWQNLYATGTSYGGSRGSNTYAQLGAVSEDLRSGNHFYLYGPYLAQPTAMRAINVTGEAGATIDENAVTHSLSTSYDGVTFYPNSNDMTGALTIYGLSQ